MRRFSPVLLSCLLSACSTLPAEPVNVSSYPAGAFEPDLAIAPGGPVVTWYDDRNQNAEIYLRAFNHSLTPLSAPLRLTDSPESSYEADVAVLGSNMAVTWYEVDTLGMYKVMLGMWDTSGSLLWQRQMSAPGTNARIPLIKTAESRIFIAWAQSVPDEESPVTDIFGAWLDSSGNDLVAPFRIASAGSNTWNLNGAVLPDKRIALVYDAPAGEDQTSNEITLSLIRENHATTSLMSLPDGTSSLYPDIAVSDQQVALTWFDNLSETRNDIFLAIFPLTRLSAVRAPEYILDEHVVRVTNNHSDSIGAYLAWNNNVLGLAWNENSSGPHQIYFQAYTAEGLETGERMTITNTMADSRIPSITPWRDGFLLSWNEVVYASGHDDGSVQSLSDIVMRYVPVNR